MISKGFNIILEGCDGAGKTSIANVLLRHSRLPWTYIKRDNPKDYENGYKLNRLDIETLNTDFYLIFDRGPLGEKIYAPLYRGYYPEYMDELEKKLEPHNFLFLVDTTPEIIKNRWDGKFIKENHIKTIIRRFKMELLASYYPNKYVVNNSECSAIYATVKILGYIYNRYPKYLSDFYKANPEFRLSEW